MNSWLVEEVICRNGEDGRFEILILEEYKVIK